MKKYQSLFEIFIVFFVLGAFSLIWAIIEVILTITNSYVNSVLFISLGVTLGLFVIAILFFVMARDFKNQIEEEQKDKKTN